MYPEFREVVKENGWEARRFESNTPTFEQQQEQPVAPR